MYWSTAIAAVAATLIGSSSAARAGELNIGVILSGEITPGVYGQVMIGNTPPPPLLYAQPLIVERLPRGVHPTPVYLHVPPGHARKWARHCHRYNACGRPVYFVRSAEYERDDAARGKGKPGQNGRDQRKD
jgi:hypothetical protein